MWENFLISLIFIIILLYLSYFLYKIHVIVIPFENVILYVNEKTESDSEKNLVKCDLRELLKKDVQSVDEVILESEIAKNEIELIALLLYKWSQ